MSYRLFYRLLGLFVRKTWTVIPSDTVFFKKTVKSTDFQRLTNLPSDTVFLSNG